MKKKNDLTDLSLSFGAAIEGVLSDGSIELTDENAADVFTALILSCNLVHNSHFVEEKNALEFSHLVNHLIFMYLLKNQKQCD